MKFRDISTAIAMTISLACLTASLNFSATVKKEMMKKVKDLGLDIITIEHIPQSTEQNDTFNIPLREKDALQLKALQELAAVAMINRKKIFIHDKEGRLFPLLLLGVSPDFFQLQNNMIIKGKALSEQDYNLTEELCVIDEYCHKRINHNIALHSLEVSLPEANLKVKGIISSTLPSLRLSSTGVIIVPLTLFRKIISDNSDELSMLIVKTENDLNLVKTEQFILSSLMSERVHKNFSLLTHEKLVKKRESAVKTIGLLVNIVPLFILFVSSLSGANIQLVTVSERKKEIGLRIALGATRKNIITMFLREGFISMILAGLPGLLIGIVITNKLLSRLPNIISGYRSWTFSLSIPALLISILFLFSFSIIFSLVPALNASKLDPAITLREE